MGGVLNIWHERYDTTKFYFFLKLVVYSDECNNHGKIYRHTVELCRHLLSEETAL